MGFCTKMTHHKTNFEIKRTVVIEKALCKFAQPQKKFIAAQQQALLAML